MEQQVGNIKKGLKKTVKNEIKKQEKALKRLQEKPLVVRKQPEQSKKPSKRVAKNVLALKQSARDRNVEAGLLTYLAPGDYPPQRMGSSFGAFKSAASNPSQAVVSQWAALQNGNVTDTVMFGFRSLALANITVWNDTSSTGWTYTGTATSEIVQGALVPQIMSPFAYTGGPTAQPVHGDALFPGRLGNTGRTYVWIDLGSKITITNGSSASVTYAPFAFNSSGGIDAYPGLTIASLGSFTWGVPVSGYYGFDVQTATSTTLTTTYVVNRGIATTGFAHLATPGYYANLSSVGSAQVQGVSIMFTNEASPLNKQGKVACIQLPAGEDWRSYLGYNTIAGLKEPYRDIADQGCYGFLIPTGPSDYDYFDHTYTTSGNTTIAWFDMTWPFDCIVIQVQVTTTAGQDGYFTRAQSFNFRTNNVWWEVAKSNYTPGEVQAVMALIPHCPQWHKNDFHVSDIWNWLKNAAVSTVGAIRDALPTIINTASTVAKIGTAVAAVL